jgi:WD40 repeat protein
VSPDGRQLAVQIGHNNEAEIYLYDLSGDSEPRRLAFEGRNIRPAWTADGEWIAFVSDRDGAQRIWRQRVNGSGTAEPLTEPGEGRFHNAPAWTPDGRLAYTEQVPAGDNNIWIRSVPDGDPELLVGREGSQFGIAFSPDGKAMAYASGGGAVVSSEIWVEPYPPDGSRVRVAEEGQWPFWSRDSGQLSFQPPSGGITTVDIDTDNLTVIRNRRTLALPGLATNTARFADSLPDSDQFFVTVPPIVSARSGVSPSAEIVIVENWIEEVKRLVPTN